jgi:Clustered mitochondria
VLTVRDPVTIERSHSSVALATALCSAACCLLTLLALLKHVLTLLCTHTAHQQGVRTLQGDGAAHKSAAHDLRNIALLSSLDVPDLYTLGTTIVDYLGCRLVSDLLQRYGHFCGYTTSCIAICDQFVNACLSQQCLFPAAKHQHW